MFCGRGLLKFTNYKRKLDVPPASISKGMTASQFSYLKETWGFVFSAASARQFA